MKSWTGQWLMKKHKSKILKVTKCPENKTNQISMLWNDSNETERRQHDPYGTALAKAQVMLLDKESIDIWYL